MLINLYFFFSSFAHFCLGIGILQSLEFLYEFFLRMKPGLISAFEARGTLIERATQNDTMVKYFFIFDAGWSWKIVYSHIIYSYTVCWMAAHICKLSEVHQIQYYHWCVLYIYLSKRGHNIIERKKLTTFYSLYHFLFKCKTFHYFRF